MFPVTVLRGSHGFSLYLDTSRVELLDLPRPDLEHTLYPHGLMSSLTQSWSVSPSTCSGGRSLSMKHQTEPSSHANLGAFWHGLGILFDWHGAGWGMNRHPSISGSGK